MRHHLLRSARLLLIVSLLCVAPLALPAPTGSAAGNAWTVNDVGDSGATTCAANAGAGGATCQLRDALSKVGDGDTISFSVTGTIGISAHGTLIVGHSVAIAGPASGAGVTLDGGHTVQVLVVNGGVTVNISNLTIANGQKSGTSAGIGNAGALTLTHCVLTGNQSASALGGAITNTGTLTVSNSTISGNAIIGSFGDGGGIYNHAGTVSLLSSTVSGNSAAYGAGVYNESGGTATIANSTITGNIAASSGGGIMNINQGTTTTIINSTITGNQNSDGSGINNLANPTLNLTNTIVSGNTGSADIGGDTPPTVNSHTLIGGTALLGPLGADGGPTQTISLLAGSPAIGAGDPTVCANTSGTGAVGGVDQRGLPRPAARCSIGAFEQQQATYTVGATSDTGAMATFAACADGANATCKLRDALAYASSGGDTVQFDTGGRGTITAGSPLKLAASVTVIGPTSGAGVTLDGGHAVQVLAVNGGVTASISNLTVAHGNAGGNAGGGINNNGTLTVTNCTFSGNSTASATGGGGIANNGTLTVTNCTFSGNSTVGATGGGGIANSGTLTVTNCTFSGNSAAGGGGINNNGTLTVSNSTISNNSATSSGGGIANSSGTVHLTNTIVSGNSAQSGPSDYLGPAPISNHSLIGGAEPLASLANYGGMTQTMPPLPGSPAIDNGDDATCAATGPGAVGGADQRGVSRTVHGVHCDIGAVESQGFVFSSISGSNQTTPVDTAFAPLVVVVGSTFNEPVAGGVVTFTGPAAGAGIQGGPLTGTIGTGATASVTPNANGTAGGAYSVSAATTGATPVVLTFSLTNTPVVSAIGPTSGGVAGGATVTLSGAGFGPGTTVTFGGLAATNVVLVNSTTVTAKTPPHGAGTVDVAVAVNGATTTVGGGYTYGVVDALPGPQPSAAAGGPPNVQPSTRPTGGSASAGNLSPLPAPRP